MPQRPPSNPVSFPSSLRCSLIHTNKSDTRQQRLWLLSSQTRDSVRPGYVTLSRGSNLADMGRTGHTQLTSESAQQTNKGKNREFCLSISHGIGFCLQEGGWHSCQLVSSSGPSLVCRTLLMRREASGYRVGMIQPYWAGCLWCLGRAAKLNSGIILWPQSPALINSNWLWGSLICDRSKYTWSKPNKLTHTHAHAMPWDIVYPTIRGEMQEIKRGLFLMSDLTRMDQTVAFLALGD